MKKIIITGGLGYLGSNIAKRLIKEGFEVIILDNFLSNTCNKVLRSKIIKCDITNYDKLKDCIRERKRQERMRSGIRYWNDPSRFECKLIQIHK